MKGISAVLLTILLTAGATGAASAAGGVGPGPAAQTSPGTGPMAGTGMGPGAMAGQRMGPRSGGDYTPGWALMTAAERNAHLELMRSVFGGNVIVLPVKEDGNHIAFAFRDATFEPRWRWMDGQVKAMRKRYGLDFPKFAGKLERSRKLGYLKRIMHQPEEFESEDAGY